MKNVSCSAAPCVSCNVAPLLKSQISNLKFQWGRSGRRAIGLETAALSAWIALAGCTTPVKSPAHATLDKTGKGARSSNASHVVSIPENSNESAPISRMTVQGEQVEAADLWLEHHDELETKYKELSQQQFRVFVAERSAQLITDKIAEVLLYQRAKLRMPDGMDKKIEEYADGEIRKAVTADYGGVQRRYEKKLEKQGRSLEAVREQLRRQIVISSFLDNEVRPRVAEPTRADLYEAFQNNIDAWRKPARRSMSLIDVRISEFLPKDAATPTREQSEAARAQARQRIEAARTELGTGTPFADVAREYSQGVHVEEGGAWGYVNGDSVRERFVPAVESLAKLDAGRVSDIVETPDGFFWYAATPCSRASNRISNRSNPSFARSFSVANTTVKSPNSSSNFARTPASNRKTSNDSTPPPSPAPSTSSNRFRPRGGRALNDHL